MSEDTATVTVRLPKPLLEALDREGERRSLLAGATGLISRNAMLRVALEHGLKTLQGSVTPAVSAAVAVSPQGGPRTPDAPAITEPVDAPAPKPKAKHPDAVHTPAVANRTRPDPDALRQRCQAYCAEHPDAKPGLAKAMGYESVAALGNWLRGDKTAAEAKRQKAERWLEKRGV